MRYLLLLQVLILWTNALPILGFANQFQFQFQLPFSASPSIHEDKKQQQQQQDSKVQFKKINSSAITRDDFHLWLEEQQKISFEHILNNIGGLGDHLPSTVAKGVVIASPSKENPNYFYQWVRDAAITMNSLVEYLHDTKFEQDQSREQGSEYYNLQPIVESYIENAYYIQRTDNPSGEFDDDLLSLGEPKFMTDNTAFTDNWGRPQRDGPGLRVITITNYLKLLMKTPEKQVQNDFLHNETWIFDHIVKPDLKYIMKYWNHDGFDLWEEIYSKHLFTSLTQLKALKIGIELCNNNGKTPHYKCDTGFKFQLEQAFIQLRSFIEVYGFKTMNVPYLIETPTLFWKSTRNGLDIASILASLRAHEGSYNSGDGGNGDNDDDDEDNSDVIQIPFDVTDPHVLNTLSALVNDMKYRYPINHKRNGLDQNLGMALGRYPEDVYNGNGISEGNPWFIATATASEFLYRLIYQLYVQKQDIDLEVAFYKEFLLASSQQQQQADLYNNMIDGKTVIKYDTEEFHEFAINLIKYADSFLDVIREHVDNQGSMSEQFNRYSGFMEGATDLTWSYGSLWSSFRWRNKVLVMIQPTGEGEEI